MSAQPLNLRAWATGAIREPIPEYGDWPEAQLGDEGLTRSTANELKRLAEALYCAGASTHRGAPHHRLADLAPEQQLLLRRIAALVESLTAHRSPLETRRGIRDKVPPDYQKFARSLGDEFKMASVSQVCKPLLAFRVDANVHAQVLRIYRLQRFWRKLSMDELERELALALMQRKIAKLKEQGIDLDKYFYLPEDISVFGVLRVPAKPRTRAVSRALSRAPGSDGLSRAPISPAPVSRRVPGSQAQKLLESATREKP